MPTTTTQQPQRQHVWVVVLGDFGRSPRMQYHALSLSQQGYAVDVVAMRGSPPIATLRQAPNVRIHHVPQLPAWASRLPSLLGLLLKAAFQLLALLWLMLLRLPRPAAILMQNPPAIPSMAVCWLAAARHRAAWVIDWHNTAFSIMQLKYGRHAWLIRLARSIEQRLGAQAAAHFCVTKAFKQWLEAEFGLSGVLVLYDRPPAMFHPCSLREAHALLARLQPALAADGIGTCLQRQLEAAAGAGAGDGSSTLLTCCTGPQGAPAWRPGRPALVVSSTSWTPDEDFGILLAAAEAYDAAAAAAAGGNSKGSSKGSSRGSSSSYPDVVFVITGRGPQRDMYLSRIRQLSLSKVAFCSMWLEPENYPLMLGAADLGVCLHTSSSGLDLPMKVVDMFGAGLPVCAVDYDCITELVQPGVTGLLFKTPQQLAQQLLELLEGFPGSDRGDGGAAGEGQLAGLRAGVAKEQSAWRWQDNWQAVAAPVFAHYARAGNSSGQQAAAAVAAASSPPPTRKAKKVA